MGIVSGGGGGSFNGGTITTPLIANLSAPAVGLELLLNGAAGLNVGVGTGALFDYAPNPSGQAEMTFRSTGELTLTNAAGDDYIGYTAGPNILDLDAVTGGVQVMTSKGLLRISLTSEPADADIPNGYYACWLDTGASALKVKAKWGGTYKTAVIALA